MQPVVLTGPLSDDCVVVLVCMMELAREMILLSTVLLYLANSVYPQGTVA